MMPKKNNADRLYFLVISKENYKMEMSDTNLILVQILLNGSTRVQIDSNGPLKKEKSFRLLFFFPIHFFRQIVSLTQYVVLCVCLPVCLLQLAS